jgi:hypothetical protein
MSNHGKITQRSSATFLGDMAKSSRVTKRLSTPTLHPNLHYNAGQLHNSAGRLMMLLNSLPPGPVSGQCRCQQILACLQ